METRSHPVPNRTRPPDPDYEAKLTELNRVCGSASVHPELRKIVRWLGDQTLADPEFTASARQICIGVGRITDKDEMTKSDQSWFRGHMLRARETRLAAFYKKPSSQKVPFRIYLPPMMLRDGASRNAPYALLFHDRRERADRSEVVAVWQKMVHAIDKIKSVVLIYDTPMIMTDNPAMNEPGTWAGSGEVAAACFLGETIARLTPAVEIDVRRWHDIDDIDIVKPWQCVIILGSSLKNKRLQRLRQREHLKDRQSFQFVTALPNEGQYGSIKSADEQFIFIEPTEDDAGMEYALISFFRDPTHQQVLIALQGITTVGTLAAAHFMTSQAGVDALSKALKTSGTLPKSLPSMELLLEVYVYKRGKLGDMRLHRHAIQTSEL